MISLTPAEDAFFHRLLSSAGMTSQFLRGAENTRAANVKMSLSESAYAAAVVVDASCANAHKFLDLVSERDKKRIKSAACLSGNETR